MKIYNSLSNKIENFKSVNKKEINLYVCGPTVYDDIHIGNARPVIFFSLLKNYFIRLGYQVKYVSNITDLDDKIINKAIQKNISEKDLADKYAKEFLKIVRALKCDNVDLYPYATHYINQMQNYISNLVNKDYAYVLDDGIYFRVNKIKTYGQLSNQNLDELYQNVRKDTNSKKEFASDFSLWKKTDTGITYNLDGISGRPGWHTECAVMIKDIFKEMPIDIHGGGFDLKFPHHENEIAQCCASEEKQLANYFMHVGRLDLSNQKMSKSEGNVIKVKNLIKEVDSNIFKLLILGHHYRLPINYNEDLLEQYKKIHEKIVSTFKRVQFILLKNNIKKTKKQNEDVLVMFDQYMQDDFNTPNVITLIELTLKQLNTQVNDFEYLQSTMNSLVELLKVFNIKISIRFSKDILEVHNKWIKAREDKNYALADELRTILAKEGLI